MKSRGLFVLFEGGDKSGKSTQCGKLRQYLEKDLNLKVKQYSFPDRLEPHSGEKLNNFLKKKEMFSPEEVHLMFSDNRWFLNDQLKKDLESGISVVCDRYSYSGIVYSASKLEFTVSGPFTKRYFKENNKPLPALPLIPTKFDILIQPDVGLLAPDLVVVLETPVDIALKRDSGNKEIFEYTEIQQRVILNFHALACYLTGYTPFPVGFLNDSNKQANGSFLSQFPAAVAKLLDSTIDDLFDKIAGPWFAVDSCGSVDSVFASVKLLFDKCIGNFRKNGEKKPLSLIDYPKKLKN